MGQFKPMPKMKTTEPSVELKLKKGGKVKMMDGGEPMMAAPARRRMPMAMAPRGANPMVRAGMPMRKEGGAMDKAQDKAMVKKAFKQHDAQEHKGGKGTNLKLRGGGMAPKAGPNVMGGLAGGISATRTDKKKSTGDIELSKYKNGGMAAKGMATARKYETKINDASNLKPVKGGSGGIEGSKFKKGGLAAKGMALANKYQTKINDASKIKTVKGGSGGIEGSKFKSGGHVAMTCKSDGGFTAMKKMQKC
jgi:hypothetical protein